MIKRDGEMLYETLKEKLIIAEALEHLKTERSYSGDDEDLCDVKVINRLLKKLK